KRRSSNGGKSCQPAGKGGSKEELVRVWSLAPPPSNGEHEPDQPEARQQESLRRGQRLQRHQIQVIRPDLVPIEQVINDGVEHNLPRRSSKEPEHRQKRDRKAGGVRDELPQTGGTFGMPHEPQEDDRNNRKCEQGRSRGRTGAKTTAEYPHRRF